VIPSPDECYAVLLAQDARFDGVFFTGVSSTGIYCRPICPVKTPKRENCTFYASAALAEKAGFRPCLRCRPELAPGHASVDAVGRLAHLAASRIEEGALCDGSVEDLAAELGVTSRHLRRVVEAELGVTPIELAQTHRLLLAKRLLTDTALPVGEVALASGFGSLRRFNALFRERYRLSPTDLRRGRAATKESLRCNLRLKPPFDWGWMLSYLGGRGYAGVEVVRGRTYFRTLKLGDFYGWFGATFDDARSELSVEVSSSLAPVLPKVMARVKRLFDTDADSCAIASHLGDIAGLRPGVRVAGCCSGFELAVRAILGQRISVRAATTLAGRYAEAFGEPMESPIDGLCRLSPAPERIAQAEVGELASLGMTGARAQAIISLASAVSGGSLKLRPGVDVERAMAQLVELPGIGVWTAQYVAMRALRWPDAFPSSDLGVMQALGEANPRRVEEISQQWRPFRAYAAMQLWRSLGDK
jgi:AraC family transcriptional regulator of adaptative response / DNA-3-methyladenine glycosylase II